MTAFGLDGTDGNHTPIHAFPLPTIPDGRYVPSMDHMNRYKLINPATGKVRSWTRATTLAKILDDTYKLDRWRERVIASGLVNDPDARERAEAAYAAGSKARMDAAVSAAYEAAGGAYGAEFGTAVHAWLEAIDTGVLWPADVPEIFRPHVDHYLDRIAAHALWPVPEYTERIVLNTAAGCVGTLDRIYVCADGTLALGDVKTSKGLEFSWLAYAVQLTIYAEADLMLSIDGERWEPMPDIRKDFAVLAHVPSDNPEGTSMVTYDLDAGRYALDLAVRVREARSAASKVIPYRHAIPTPDPDTAVRARAATALMYADTAAAVSDVWSEFQSVWNDGLTTLGAARIEAINAHENGE